MSKRRRTHRKRTRHEVATLYVKALYAEWLVTGKRRVLEEALRVSKAEGVEIEGEADFDYADRDALKWARKAYREAIR